jgi:3-methyladenine DNA glycosylase AlkD
MMEGWIEQFRHRLKEAGDPERAKQEKRYLKSPFQFYGVTVPKLRALAREFRRQNPEPPKEWLWALAWKLWRAGFHEERALAMFLLDEYSALLDYSDMPALETMLQESVNWDQVDEISVHLAGAVLEKDPRAFDFVRRWSGDESFWMRRAALLSQLLLFRNGKGDRTLFYSLAEAMLEEKEFFIRKAIGWVLRELTKLYPDEVLAFVERNRSRMSGVTFREATRRLPEQLRQRLVGRPRLG